MTRPQGPTDKANAAVLLTPNRSTGGQRRYNRAEFTLAAAIRIVSLEHQVAVAPGEPRSDPNEGCEDRP